MSVHSITVKTVHSLEAELIRLRESTKDALQQSWEEVETLQQQCAAHLDIANQLEAGVIEARRKEEYWHKRCLDAEFQLLQQGGKSGNNLSSSDPDKSHGFRMPWQAIGMKGQNQDSDSTVETNSLETESQREAEDGSSSHKDSEKVAELEAKLNDRESAICSLETTVERHVRAMHSMQAEMQCMMETQRIKEKKGQATYRRKESFLEEQLSNLQNDIEKKEKVIATQKKRSDDYKEYIEELCSELENVLAMLKQAEKNGIDLESLRNNQQ